MQLQSFLFEENVPQEYLTKKNTVGHSQLMEAFTQSEKYVCHNCPAINMMNDTKDLVQKRVGTHRKQNVDQNKLFPELPLSSKNKENLPTKVEKPQDIPKNWLGLFESKTVSNKQKPTIKEEEKEIQIAPLTQKKINEIEKKNSPPPLKKSFLEIMNSTPPKKTTTTPPKKTMQPAKKIETIKFVYKELTALEYFKRMGKGVLRHILHFLPFIDLFYLSQSCVYFREFIQRNQIIEIRELSCFYTKDSFEDQNTILGFGLNLQRHPKGYEIKEIDSFIDPISWYGKKRK